jgi:hypothetical protein
MKVLHIPGGEARTNSDNAEPGPGQTREEPFRVKLRLD